jgi:hypothetical protein
VSAGDYAPEFTPTDTWYIVGVPAGTQTIDIIATPNDPNATVVGNVQGLALSDTLTVVNITVTAANGNSTETYTVGVVHLDETRLGYEPFDEQAWLKGIFVSPGALQPKFDPATSKYVVAVDCEVKEMMITAAQPVGAHVEIVSNLQSTAMPMPLGEGVTDIYVMVMVDNRYIARYTLSVSRSLTTSTIIPYWDDVLAVNLNSVTNGGYNFTDFQWYHNGEPIANATGAYLYNNGVPLPGGEYTVKATTADGAEIVSCPCMIVQDVGEATKLAVYPNPATRSVTVAHPEADASSIELYDMKGTLLHSYPASGTGSTSINISHLPADAYVVRTGNKSTLLVINK